MRYLAFALILATACKGGEPTPRRSFESIRPLMTGPSDFEAFWGGPAGDEAFVDNFIKSASKHRKLSTLEKIRVETRIFPRFKRLTYEQWRADPATEKIVKKIEELSFEYAKEMAEMLK